MQPWTAKIDAKKAELDMALSERDTLSKKAEALKKTYEEALESLNSLRSDLEAKVKYLRPIYFSQGKLIFCAGNAKGGSPWDEGLNQQRGYCK